MLLWRSWHFDQRLRDMGQPAPAGVIEALLENFDGYLEK